MKRLLTITALCVGILTSAGAQTFTERIQQATPGQGTVTIHQDKTIDQLVNTATLSASKTQATPSHQTTTASQHTTDRPDAAEQASEGRTSQSTVKVTGYRVQVYAGYNREGKQTAERTRNSLKSQFPNVPVYVNFFNPRWVCRMGNYRTYEEAHQMLVSLRNLGYKEASVVKGKITVQY